MALLLRIMSRYGLPQQVISRRGLGDLEPVDLNVGEGVGFLEVIFRKAEG